MRTNYTYFCHLEKRNFVQKAMSCIERENGEIIHNVDIITQETKEFYERLYASRECLIDSTTPEYLHNPTLSEADSESLEGEITLNELLASVKRQNNGKSPGSDGYTAEFFKFFFTDLGKFMLRAVNYGFQYGEMSITQRQGIITCLPKPGKDKKFLKNWRPISLLNTVYKITSSCIAERIKSVLPSVIHEDQTGFIKGRYIAENIRLVYDTLLYAEKHNRPGQLFMVDFEKAFDSVAWSFVDTCLKKFNFGNDVRRWVSTFYCNITSCVHVNGQYSQWFSVKRGVRQGDALSPYLFIICAEIMALMVRQNASVKGMRVSDKEVLLSQYADDTTFFLDGSEESFSACVQILRLFASMSGIAINFEKSVVVWIGSLKNSKTIYRPELKLTWNPETFKVLGIIFSTNINDITKINYENKLMDVKKILNSWSRRKLTPFGKVTVIKTLAISTLTYLFTNLPDPPDKFLKDLDKMLFDFLWDGKTDKIKRDTIKQQYTEGGLKMIDVRCFVASLKITWLKRLNVRDKIFNLMTGMYPFLENIKNRGGEYANVLMQRVKNPFWADVFRHYKSFCASCAPKSFSEFVNECLHYNVNITVDKKSGFYSKFY